MLKKFAKQFSISKRAMAESSHVTPPYSQDNSLLNPFLKGLTKRALNLYEKNADIKKFAKLALSDPDNTDCNDRVKEVMSSYQDDLFDLTNNEKFLKDLGL